MNVVLVENTTPGTIVNKDQMGGYGIGPSYGKSPPARLLSRLKGSSCRIPLLTLGYAAAILKRNGHKIAVYNAEDGPPPRAELYVVHSSIVECRREVEFARWLKNNQGGAKVCFVGPFASHCPEIYLEAADCVVKGEPELFFSTVRNLADIPRGIALSPMVQDLESLPFPDWGAFDLGRYGYWPILSDKPFVPVQSSRGCSFRCSYCPYIVQYPEWRMRSAEHTVEEIRWLIDRHAIKSFLFRDPLFTQGEGRAEAIAEGMLRSGLHRKVRWACETRTDLLNEKLIDVLHAAGLRGLNVGVESVDTSVLRSANRNQSHAYSERMISYAEKKGIKVAAFYVFGLPADTTGTIQATVDYAKRLNTFAAQFHISTPFPGTAVHAMQKDSIVGTDWEKFTSFALVFKHPNLGAEELDRLKESAYGGYYFRGGYLKKHWRHLLEQFAAKGLRR